MFARTVSKFRTAPRGRKCGHTIGANIYLCLWLLLLLEFGCFFFLCAQFIQSRWAEPHSAYTVGAYILKSWYRLATVVIALGMAGLSSQPQARTAHGPISEEWHEFPGYGMAWKAGIAVIDVDGDGMDDFAFGVDARDTRLLLVVGRGEDGLIAVKQSVVVGSMKLARVLAVPDEPSGERIYTIAEDGTVTVYGGWPLRLMRRFQVAARVTSAVIGDITGNGQKELVVGSAECGVCAYAASTGAVVWTNPAAWGEDLTLANLTGGSAVQVVTSAEVIDGASGVAVPGYVYSFGIYLASLSASAQGQARIVAGSWDLSVFDGQAPWAPLWTLNTPTGVGAVTVADLDGDGREDILWGDAQHGSAVHVLDGVTYAERRRYSALGSHIHGIAVGDSDADGSNELAVVVGFENYGGFHLLDHVSGASRFSATGQGGYFTATAIGDLDGDGRLEHVAGSSFGREQSGFVRIMDLESGAPIWSGQGLPTTVPSYAFGDGNVAALALRPSSAANSLDIVIGGEIGYPGNGYLSVIDGVTHEITLQVRGDESSSPLWKRPVSALALLDFDRDGVLDIVAAVSQQAWQPYSAPQLQVFSGRHGGLLAQSAPLGSPDNEINGLFVSEGGAGAASELVLVLNDSLQGFDSHSLAHKWSLVARAKGARYVDNGVDGAEILIFNGNGGISFYNAQTRGFLRSVPTPMNLTAVLPLGDTSNLLLAAEDKLQLMDGVTGNIRASTEFLGSRLSARNQLAAAQVSEHVWRIASGSNAGHLSHRLNTSDVIYADDFESAPSGD